MNRLINGHIHMPLFILCLLLMGFGGADTKHLVIKAIWHCMSTRQTHQHIGRVTVGNT